MDVIASRIALGSGLKKGKALKKKIKTKKLSKPAESVKSTPRFTKKKNLQTKVDKPKSKKGVLKETLKNFESGDSTKLYKKVAKPLEKVVKNKKTPEIPQVVKNEKRMENKEITKKVKKEPNIDNEEILQKVKKQKSKKTEPILQKAKKRKVNETQIITQKAKKEKKSKEPKKDTVIIKNESTKSTCKPQLSLEHFKKSVAAILKLSQDQTNSKDVLIAGESLPIFLQVVCVKIPETPSRQLRILLPHTLVSPDDDIALIVCDVKRGRRRDHEPTVDHFQQLLKDHKCTQIKTVIPMNQIKNEYDQYELKMNLVNSYDHFLVDGRISGHVARLLGKIFTKKRKLPTSIRMGSKDLKHEIDYALSKTTMKLNSKGDSHTMQIGTTSMQKSEIVENIVAACDKLAKDFPGGWANVRSLLVKTGASLGIPIYITMKNKNKVIAPVIQPKRPKAYRTYEGELTTLDSESNVTVTPEGKVILKSRKIKTEVESETETENEDEDEIEDEVKDENEDEEN